MRAGLVLSAPLASGLQLLISFLLAMLLVLFNSLHVG